MLSLQRMRQRRYIEEKKIIRIQDKAHSLVRKMNALPLNIKEIKQEQDNQLKRKENIIVK